MSLLLFGGAVYSKIEGDYGKLPKLPREVQVGTNIISGEHNEIARCVGANNYA